MVACLLFLVRERRNSRTYSWDMLARSRLPNLDVNRLRTNAQVLTVFFFGVGLVVLQMEFNCLGYFHGVPPLDGVVGGKRHAWSIHHGEVIGRRC